LFYVESNRMSERKRTVIEILRGSPDFVSGEAISDVLGISRNAVHKHVKVTALPRLPHIRGLALRYNSKKNRAASPCR